MNEMKQWSDDRKDPDMRIKKWMPLLEGTVNDCHGHLAWCLEEEALYLKSLTEEERENQLGAFLKYVFPVIRKSVEGFSALDRIATLDDRESLAGVFQYQVELACDAICAVEREDRGQDVDEEAVKSNSVMSSLGSRLADYTLSYPRLN
jgi:hypothetical protein